MVERTEKTLLKKRFQQKAMKWLFKLFVEVYRNLKKSPDFIKGVFYKIIPTSKYKAARFYI